MHWKLPLTTFRWVPICQGFSHFKGFLNHFVLAKLATDSKRVNRPTLQVHLFGARLPGSYVNGPVKFLGLVVQARFSRTLTSPGGWNSLPFWTSAHSAVEISAPAKADKRMVQILGSTEPWDQAPEYSRMQSWTYRARDAKLLVERGAREFFLCNNILKQLKEQRLKNVWKATLCIILIVFRPKVSSFEPLFFKLPKST